MTITIVGSGYVGLVTGAVFGDLGHRVFCVDIDVDKISKLQEGQIPFYEPELPELVKKGLINSNLIFTTSFEKSIPDSEIIFMCVGTPQAKNGEADISYLLSAARSVAKNLTDGTIIALKSTVPVGIEKKLKEIINKITKAEYEIVSTPEFLREGTAVNDTKNPDRIVIGAETENASKTLLNLYKDFPGERIVCDITSAIMIKYTANSFLATKISYANAIAEIAERLGADAEIVLKGMGLDKRIGTQFFRQGIGYGGSCFPKDVAAFIHTAKTVNYDFQLLKATIEINKMQVINFVEKLKNTLKTFKDKQIAVLGLAFKPNTDDIREAPSIKIINLLLKYGAKISVYDPKALENTKKILKNQVKYYHDPYETINKAEALLLITEWDEFKNLNFKKVKQIMKNPLIFDGRNMLDEKLIRNLGFKYYRIGKGFK